MENILSNSFIFKVTSNSVKGEQYQNILYLNDENNSKHFVQYIQYYENDDSIDLRHMSIQMDRSYFLEIANVCINNSERKRLFFSTLGKRRFGASNKHLDCYITHKELDEKLLLKQYLNHYEFTEFEPFYRETTKYSTNKYRVYIKQDQELHIVFLDQLNISARKKIHKIFCTDITSDDLDLYNSMTTPLQKINYLFNKIGKNHFRSLEKTHLKKTKHYSTNEELALSMLITGTKAMEKSSLSQDNTSYRTLQDRISQIGQIDLTLIEAANNFINNPKIETEEVFTFALKTFILHIKDINGLKDIAMHLQEVHELTATNTISYLLSKNDQDLQDILIYMLESFSTWNKHLYSEDANTKSFNSASIDLADALRYFVDICYKFKHDYKCSDAEEEILKEAQTTFPLTSAQSYFSEIDLDSEVYDELLELERDVDILTYSTKYTENINTALICYFGGYTRVLNPLFEFKDLSYSLMLLIQKLTDYQIDENSEILLVLIRGLISDLHEWKRTVLVEQTAEDIHYMDKSFYSNITQIEMSLESNFVDDDDDGIEFF
jgi:hypothetical protein